MNAVGGLARRTLDELPLNVAVIAAGGEIVDTNEAWESFGERAGRDTGDVGENYFAAASEDDEAVAGIRSVLAGEREVYVYEYPCHSPTERQWFLMRVTRFDLDGEPYAVVAHIDITERKLAELETEHVLERVDGLVTDVTTALVAATSRAEIVSGVLHAAVGTAAYDAALVARENRVTDEIVVDDTSEGTPEVPAVPDDGDSVVARTLREREVRAVDDLRAVDDPWARVAAAAGFETMVAVPFATADTAYAALVVFSRQSGVFDPRERRLLRALGRTTGTAIRAMESAWALVATSLVEVELTTGSDALFYPRLSRELDCTLDYRGSLPADDDSSVVFFEVAGVDPDAVLEWATAEPELEAASVIWSHDGDALVEFRLAAQSLPARLADRGVDTRELSVEDGVARFTLLFPADRNAREVVEIIEADHPDVELAAVREINRPKRSPREAWAELADDLTPRQHAALTKAYVSGFFDWPRDVTGDDLADSMDITRATFHQHLRAAERKLVSSFFDDPD
jgi:PAS domain S-box-containing protein